MSNTLKHKTLTGKPAVAGLIAGPEWDSEHTFAGGANDGDVLQWSSAQSDKVKFGTLQFPVSGATGRNLLKLTLTPAAAGTFNLVSLEPTNATDPRPNCHMHFGYNISTGPTLGPEKAGENAIEIGFEGYFEQSGARYVENYLQYWNTAGVALRPWFVQIDRSTDAIQFVLRGDPVRIVDQNAQEIARFTTSGFLNVGSTAIGAVGSLMFEGVSSSPRSCRILFGTDDGGWELRFSKRNGASSTDLWSLKDTGHLVPVTTNVRDIGSSSVAVRKGYFTDLQFGTNTTKAAEAFASYITITDAGGVSRKIMVCA